MSNLSKAAITACVGLMLVGTAAAAPITFTGSSGSLAASVTFDTSGTDLLVTLTNTSTADALVPIDILTGVFFDVGGSALSLSRTSAVVPLGSSVFYGPIDPGNVVGGEWAYNSGLSGPGGRDYGISSTGLGLFGPPDTFPGTDLQTPASPDGLQYGITSAGDNLATGNAPVTGGHALIQNQVFFTLGGSPPGFDPSIRIVNVLFQYGTDLSEPSFPGVPEPSSLTLLGLAALVAGRRTRSIR